MAVLGFAPPAVLTEVSAAEAAAQQTEADSWDVPQDPVSPCKRCSPSLLPRQNDDSLEPYGNKKDQVFTTLHLRTPAYKVLLLQRNLLIFSQL